MIINNNNWKKFSVFAHYLTNSTTAKAKKIDNDCLLYQANNGLKLWHILFNGLTIKFEFQCTINSFYRNKELNKLVKGVETSHHRSGHALDLNVRLMKNQLEVYEYLCSMDCFEEVFYYKLKGFIHVAYIENSKIRQYAINHTK